MFRSVELDSHDRLGWWWAWRAAELQRIALQEAGTTNEIWTGEKRSAWSFSMLRDKREAERTWPTSHKTLNKEQSVSQCQPETSLYSNSNAYRKIHTTAYIESHVRRAEPNPHYQTAWSCRQNKKAMTIPNPTTEQKESALSSWNAEDHYTSHLPNQPDGKGRDCPRLWIQTCRNSNPSKIERI